MIRLATAADTADLLRMGQQFHAESNHNVVPFDPKRTIAFIEYLIGHPDGLVVVSERDGGAIGWMAGFALPAWFGRLDVKVAYEYGLYVEPAYRHGPSAVRLATAYRDWALRHGCVQIRAGTNAGEHAQAANAIYEHLGFVQCGHAFVLTPGKRPHAYQVDESVAVG